MRDYNDLKRRKRFVSVPFKAVIDLVGAWHRLDRIAVPYFEGLPDDVVVLSAHVDYKSDALCFVVAHETFDEVEPGMMLRRIAATYEYSYLTEKLEAMEVSSG